MLGNFSYFLSSFDFCFKNKLFRKQIRNSIRGQFGWNSLDPDQVRRFVGPMIRVQTAADDTSER